MVEYLIVETDAATHRIRLTKSQKRLLAVLVLNGHRTSQELSEDLGVARSSIAKYVGRLNQAVRVQSNFYVSDLIGFMDREYSIHSLLVDVVNQGDSQWRSWLDT